MKRTLEELKKQVQQVRVIFFDIDDTLRVKDTQYLPEEIPAIFASLRELGYILAIASGRSYCGITEDIRALGADYYITINGQYVCDKYLTPLYTNPIPKEQLKKIVAWADEKAFAYGMVTNEEVVLSEQTPEIENALNVVYDDLAINRTFWKAHEIYQILTFSKDRKDDVLPKDLCNEVRSIRWHSTSCDIVPTFASKANGIEKLLAKLNVSKEEILVFGDELNDIEMFEYAGISVAMGNANEKVKPFADFVTKEITEGGVLYALKKLEILSEER